MRFVGVANDDVSSDGLVSPQHPGIVNDEQLNGGYPEDHLRPTDRYLLFYVL
jgi:hypothetical protein